MLARPHRNEVAVAFEMLRRALPLRKAAGIGEHEGFAAEHVVDCRHVAGDGEPSRLQSRGVVELVLGIQRRCEDAVRPPFERMTLSGMVANHGAAMSGKDKN